MIRSAIIASVLLAASSSSGRDDPPVVVHSNDVQGEIEPCGCRANPTGGLIRKNELLARHRWLKDAAPDQVLQIDAGDLFFSTLHVPESLRPQTEIQSLALAKALKKTGLKVFVPGEKDFSLGAAFLKKLLRESGLITLAANLQTRENSKWQDWPTASQVFRLRSKSGKLHRVGVIGIVGPKTGLPDGVRASDPVLAAKKWASRLRPKVDWLIAVTHQGFDEDLILAEKVPLFDHIIGAHSQSFLQEPRTVENSPRKTAIHQGSLRNQVVGLIRLDPAAATELVPLDSVYDPPGGTQKSELQTLVENTKAKIAEANRNEEKKMLRLVEKAKNEGTPKFQTLPQCADCHFKQFNFWRKTPHARAYEALVKANQHRNLECLSCHTVGLHDPEGFSSLHQLVEWRKDLEKNQPALEKWVQDLRTTSPTAAKEQLQQAQRLHATVQCENCHGAGRDHPFGSEPMARPRNTTSCVQCHTPERAPEWYRPRSSSPEQFELDTEKAAQKLKEMSCPIGDDET
ncbi:MAG: hypothetical protein RJB38_1278 [Pseudomonadota bacterium]|jgi:hypothetical protein